mmetsp:Transcript_17154/g.20650  ORF Transcript_17154/g.20650 Transcript_17154/m.20650 type:complete len:424 (-) Transcript_17154:169-1440(-)|eukprot:CAMPEP_0197845232 /NCGR_PEP_ID=MMETSP1438-20131217/2179_1 /TAXON_ID=1461541 /ORGANISM="Pterosperma sp., Strain CCMP1384" /LENGTH=423 /DNA_ID=CAMNT_0043456421 /DNA_START=193 /DNA_END=1464 /DNA_ORIENTATION=+
MASLETNDSNAGSTLGVDDKLDLGSYRRLACVEGASFWTRLKYHVLANHSLLGCLIVEKGDTYTRKERLTGLVLMNLPVLSIAIALTALIAFSSYEGACESTSCAYLKEKYKLEGLNHTGVLEWIRENEAEASTVPDFGHLYDIFTEEKFLGQRGDLGTCKAPHLVALEKYMPVVRGIEMVITSVLSAFIATTWEFFSRCNCFDFCSQWNLGYFVLVPFALLSIGITAVTYSICMPEACDCPCSRVECTAGRAWFKTIHNEQTEIGLLNQLITSTIDTDSGIFANETVSKSMDESDLYQCIDGNPQCAAWEEAEGQNIFLGTCNWEYSNDAYPGRCMKLYADSGLAVFLGSLVVSWVFWDFVLVVLRLAFFGTSDKSCFGVPAIPDETEVNKDKRKDARKSAYELQELQQAQSQRAAAAQAQV